MSMKRMTPCSAVVPISKNISIYNKLIEKPQSDRYLDADSLNSVIQKQEMELARDSKAYGDYTHNMTIKWKDVQRNLGDNDFDTIRIYLSTDYFNIQMSLVGSALLSKAKEHLNNVIEYIKKLIKVKPLQRKIIFRRQQQ